MICNSCRIDDIQCCALILTKLYSIIIVKGDEFMKFKRKQMLSIVLALILLVPYFGFIRDWAKPTFIEEHWIECTVDKINSYTDLSEIYNDLVKNGDFFNIGEVDDFSDGIEAVNDFLNFSIVPNEDSYNGLYNISTRDDLEKWLDYEFGEFRPVFNLMCRRYSYENGACWISPNIRLKNEYSVSDDNDQIVVVIFTEKFTMVFEQYAWGGDKPFDRFFGMFYSLLQNNET